MSSYEANKLHLLANYLNEENWDGVERILTEYVAEGNSERIRVILEITRINSTSNDPNMSKNAGIALERLYQIVIKTNK